jgi:hypothetical protein
MKTALAIAATLAAVSAAPAAGRHSRRQAVAHRRLRFQRRRACQCQLRRLPTHHARLALGIRKSHAANPHRQALQPQRKVLDWVAQMKSQDPVPFEKLPIDPKM